jgi:hypothetical protein
MEAAMRILIIAGLAAALAGAAGAHPSSRPPEEAVMCLSPTGQSEPVACRRGSSWGPADICLCPGLARRVPAPICAKGERPPAETVAYNTARREAARDGTLFGDTFEGRRMCVKLPSRPLGR